MTNFQLMQFKHPEILYFLFLLVIPILVHLFQLRRFKKEYFTNVKFLKELSIQTRKSSQLKKWLLLTTRLLLLTALIIAFAQPFFKAKDSKGVTNELYLVLDNSFSMQAKGNQGELLKRAVQELLENTPENTTFSLLTNDDTYWNTDIKSIQKELMNLEYSATSFQLDQQITKIKSRKTPFNKDVVVITDAINLQANQLKPIDETINPIFIIPKSEQKNNVAIDSVFLHQTLDNFYEIGVKLKSYGESEQEIPVAIYNQKQLIAKTQVKLEQAEKELFFTIPKADFNGYVSIEEPGLTYDNYYYFSISKPEKATVLAIGESDKNQFLTKIYTESEFLFSQFDLKSLDYNVLEKQDAIILNEIKEIPQALQTTLKSFYEKGGNIIFIPSDESNVSNVNRLLSNFGTFSVSELQKKEAQITNISFSHPLYNGVFEKKVDNFQYPNTKSKFALKSKYPSILTYEDQSPFLTAVSNSLGNFYVFSAPINKENSNFKNSPLIVPTFYNMAFQSVKTGINALTVGTSSPITIDQLLSKDEIISVVSSDEKSEKFIPQQQILNNKVKLTFVESPNKAGNYNALKDNSILKNISFNYSRTESDLRLDNSNLLESYENGSSIEAVFDALQTNRTDNTIWKWFVILALLFVILELLIQKLVK
ncbi:MAG: BatA domain-containing protein [Flavobacterium sp.]|uniref:BatA domain-containing protein n=1 Tax=Flavobacterium sp. TaxID=239 RepID=UPI003BA78497